VRCSASPHFSPCPTRVSNSRQWFTVSTLVLSMVKCLSSGKRTVRSFKASALLAAARCKRLRSTMAPNTYLSSDNSHPRVAEKKESSVEMHANNLHLIKLETSESQLKLLRQLSHACSCFPFRDESFTAISFIFTVLTRCRGARELHSALLRRPQSSTALQL